MNEAFTAPAPAGSRPVEYASFARRLGAALLDSLVWVVGVFFLFGISLAALALVILFLSIYFQLCEKRWGQTIGKNATGIRVVPLDGGELTLSATGMRNLLRLVDLPLAMVGADYLIVNGSPRRQRLGDRAAKTIVVRERPAEAAAAEPTPAPSAAAPTAGELFGDAAEALARHPEAGSAPRSEPKGEASASTGEAVAAPPGAHAPTSSWTAAGFPYARWDVRRTWLGLLAGLLIGGLFAPLLVVPFDPDLDSTWALLVAQTLLSVTLVVVATQVATGGGRRNVTRGDLGLLGLRPFRPSAFGWLALGLFSYYACAVAYGTLITEPDQKDIARDLGLDQGVLAAIPVVFLIAVVAPIAEEIFFRGMLFGGLRRRLPTLPAAAISALVFGGLHATTGVSAVPPLIIFGFVLALLYEKTGSLVPGMLAHALNNALALAVAS